MDGFPDQLHSRVIYVGVQNKKQLQKLHQELYICFNDDFKSENSVLKNPKSLNNENYLPHLTLGRIKNSCSIKDIVSPFQRKNFGKYNINSLILFESKVVNYNPIYRKLEEFLFTENQTDAVND